MTNCTYTADDFATAEFAKRGDQDFARRVDDSHMPWLAYWDGDSDWVTDGDMARCGWVPVREASGKREAWADLADVLKAWDAGESALDVDVKSMARWLHERGVRAVTGGDES